ncbi:MAG TPA: folylpolyglutamate synthase/dihydrofolate synthase family protein [Bacteroidales bacterium]|nr:folylpolyglutamate synthase/dihydrofolate synthase family protein [Bacteroidales bacterium]HRX96449.1 folylpolyglutamate synthase/dihydrofolate synthase family protein [Bacteroidales bacterium]
MNYTETLSFLFKQLPMFQRTGAAAYKADLSNTLELCRRLGNPQSDLPTIHIAGTNGKGSVSHFIASVLQEAGYKTGLFTSPHLKDFRERIKINGKVIPERKVVEFVEQKQQLINDLKPSFFEYTFSMAMNYFAEEKIDFLVAETGMGGRLDSTNVTNSVLSVITNIGFDHMRFLGDTLSKIATEKAGIIKKGVPVLIGQKQQEVKSIFISQAARVKAPIVFAEDLYSINSKIVNNIQGLKLVFSNNKDAQIIDIWSPLRGTYQLLNLLTVMAAIDQLNKTGLKISKQHITDGIANVIKNTGIRGRWEIISEKPQVICDTAHNSDGLALVLDQLMKIPYMNLHIVLGVVSDKKLDSILSMFPKGASYYFCNANIPRALPASELQELAAPFGLRGNVYGSVMEAYRVALKTMNPDDLLFIGGSTFVVAEVL